MDITHAELRRDSHGVYTIDMDVFQNAIRPDTRLFMLCNPQNPTGRIFRRDELERMAEMCLSRNVLICADEIHSDLLFDGRSHIPIAMLGGEVANRTITLIAPSKTFNLAGLQCSMAIIPNPDLRRAFQKTRRGITPWVNVMGLIATEAAYRRGNSWLLELLAYLERNRDHLAAVIRRDFPGAVITIPEATYLAWIDFRGTGIDNPYDFFLKHAQVALSNGDAFGIGGRGFVRLNFGCPRAMLDEGLQRMKRAFDQR